MKRYAVEIKKSVLQEIRHFPESVLSRIQKAIEKLASNPFPRGMEKIGGYKGYCRIRIGNYRIVYHVEKKVRIITIIKIGDRKNVYKQFR